LIRHKAEKTQVELAKLAKVPLAEVKLVESGRAASVRLGRVRAMLEALDGRARLIPWWNGAAADRLLDERHAAIAERSVRYIGSLANWQPEVEVTFAEYGERGSIDVLATNRVASAVFVGEVKSAFGSLEETNRTLDMKARLAPRIVFKHVGWRPRTVARVLIVPRDTTIRRVIESHAATMRSIYPARSRELRAWLRNPMAPISGIWFVSDGRVASTVQPDKA
jgi:hypothetical protein